LQTNCATAYAADCPNGASAVTVDGGTLTCADIEQCIVTDGSGCSYLNDATIADQFSNAGGAFTDMFACMTDTEAATNCVTECGF
jgi:hypothetical protein